MIIIIYFILALSILTIIELINNSNIIYYLRLISYFFVFILHETIIMHNINISLKKYKMYCLLNILLLLLINIIALIYSYKQEMFSFNNIVDIISLIGPLIINKLLMKDYTILQQRIINNNNYVRLEEQNIINIDSEIKLSETTKLFEQKSCSICMENFNDTEKIIKLKCNHCFHKTCIESWIKIKLKCPICKFDIIEIR